MRGEALFQECKRIVPLMNQAWTGLAYGLLKALLQKTMSVALFNRLRKQLMPLNQYPTKQGNDW
jgi:hypothetical protein